MSPSSIRRTKVSTSGSEGVSFNKATPWCFAIRWIALSPPFKTVNRMYASTQCAELVWTSSASIECPVYVGCGSGAEAYRGIWWARSTCRSVRVVASWGDAFCPASKIDRIGPSGSTWMLSANVRFPRLTDVDSHRSERLLSALTRPFPPMPFSIRQAEHRAPRALRDRVLR